MAAKVVMVAVPTVLGIASIRVYNVSEAPADGITREKLNIYTPVPQSAQVFLPERPGVIESGLTTARESIMPFVQTVKGACFSVKTGSVNLYHAGEDAYYYLKDPPPGFLPRLSTITMAGLLGMVLARKGSRFKQLAVPLGLMFAGASVCYPAQTVAVVKVTGKKVYAAGQWSSATVSSLLAPKTLEQVDKKITPSQPQSSVEFAVVEVASESSSTPRATTSEVESAVSLSAEPGVGVITEEASLVTLSDSSFDQTQTDPNTAPSQTETITTSHEPHVPVESKEPSGLKQSPIEVPPQTSTAESMLSFHPEASTSAPSTEETLAPKSSEEPIVPAVESAEADEDNQSAAVEETPTLTPPTEQPSTESQKGSSSFKADPSLLDFGQSSPEDEDLYSTRS
ncbi:MICOS complex subunit MIC27 [Betta splendens]|uniref:MICOS complex subunit n=1 Tax=Betta splendens TaxID=158456 RepID=A0A6P7NR40_BETSP|nr:MICOS complex subunit MIC27 [Betta splendens]